MATKADIFTWFLKVTLTVFDSIFWNIVYPNIPMQCTKRKLWSILGLPWASLTEYLKTIQGMRCPQGWSRMPLNYERTWSCQTPLDSNTAFDGSWTYIVSEDRTLPVFLLGRSRNHHTCPEALLSIQPLSDFPHYGQHDWSLDTRGLRELLGLGNCWCFPILL